MNSYNGRTLTLHNQTVHCNTCTITGNNNNISGHGNTVRGKNNQVSGYGNTLPQSGVRTWERRQEECQTTRVDPWHKQQSFGNPTTGFGNNVKEKQDPWQNVKPNLDTESEHEHLLCVICYQRTVYLSLVVI